MEPRPRVVSLRTLLGAAMVAVATLAFTVAVTLVVLTTYLHNTSRTLGDSFASIRLAEEVEIDLLAYERIRDVSVRHDLAEDLRQKLGDARQFVSTDDESRVLLAATVAIHRYLDAVDEETGSIRSNRDSDRVTELLTAADASIDRLVDVNIAQSRDVEVRAARWDRIASALGVGVGILLLAFVAGFQWWLRNRAFQPVFALGETMDRFGAGDREVRAPEEGPAELREMARRFNEMATSISRSRELQMTFLAGVAHDLRTPLSALRLSAGAISPDAPLPTEERIRRSFARSVRQVERLDRMIEDFLDSARIEAGQLELQFRECDVAELVRNVAELFAGGDFPHTLEVQGADAPVSIQCDSVRIEQVLTNLVSNAIKYSPKGGTVRIALRVTADAVHISVTDSGIGMGSDDQEHVFEPFRRSQTSRQGFPGVGLGLFVARRIVTGHGGQINVESEEGRGSTLEVRLPKVPPSMPAKSVR